MSQQLAENAPVRPKRKMFRFDEVQRLHVSRDGKEGSSKTKEKDVQIR